MIRGQLEINFMPRRPTPGKSAYAFARRVALGTLCATLAFGYGLLPAGCSSHRRGEVSEVYDSENHSVDPFQEADARAIVLIFVRPDCPISNRYAPEIQRLFVKYADQRIAFYLVYPDSDVSPDDIAGHLADYHFTLKPLRDPHHVLVRKAGVTRTPEAAVFLPGGREIYRGRIDDRYVDFGKERASPAQHDLDDVLGAVVRGVAVTNAFTRAVGCGIAGVP
jgi:hypothetical protein